MNIDPIFQKIRLTGKRITSIKKAILEILAQEECLVSQKDLWIHLKKQSFAPPNRSTLFRELTSLIQDHIILKNYIANTDYYELACQHHHHLVCLQCHQIKKIDICYHSTEKSQEISQENNFNILYHSLEFYGYCQKCQNQKI